LPEVKESRSSSPIVQFLELPIQEISMGSRPIGHVFSSTSRE